MLIQESGERRVIALGTVLENYNCHMMPGSLDGTVGYHVDDGRIFERGCADLGREVEGDTCASYRNTMESLGEREMLWENEPTVFAQLF